MAKEVVMEKKKIKPSPGLLRRISSARRRFYRKQSQECINSSTTSTAPPPISDLSTNEATTTTTTATSQNLNLPGAPACPTKKSWMPPLFTFSAWRRKLRQLRASNANPNPNSNSGSKSKSFVSVATAPVLPDPVPVQRRCNSHGVKSGLGYEPDNEGSDSDDHETAEEEHDAMCGESSLD